MSGTRGTRVGHGHGFWTVAFTFVVAAAFTAVPTPLYPLYQQREGLTTFAVTVVYAAYAVGVLASLLLAGHISDWMGRRRPIVFGLVAEALAAVVFVLWPTLPGLLVGRVLSGIGIGVITATAAAYLTELHAVARPGGDRSRSDLVAAAASMGGFAVGPLVSGFLAEFVAGPLSTPYLVFLVLLLAGVAGVLVTPETVELLDDRPAYRPQRVAVPDRDRSIYFAAAGTGFAVLAVLGFFASLAPMFLVKIMHQPSPALAGSVVCLVMGTAFAAQLLLDRASRRLQLTLGLSLVGVGMLTVTVSVFLPSLTLFLVGGAATGAGSGPLLKVALSTVIGLALPDAQAEVLAGFYLAGYLGLALPVLGLGLTALFVASKVALALFALVVLAITAFVGRRLLLGEPVVER